jgi:hypothetical protein
MAKKVKIIGYAKREFYDNGIEYRNFSDNLVGNQYTTEGGTPLFTLGNFNVTTNLDPKLTKNYRTSLFSRYYSLDNMNLDDDKLKITGKEAKGVTLNLDKTDLSTYAYFGSLKEFIRVSLENVITNWPASLYVTTINQTNPGATNNTFVNNSYDPLTNITQFDVNIDYIKNDFGINIQKNGSIHNTYNASNSLRDLNGAYMHYVLEFDGETYPIISFEGYSDSNFIKFKVEGDPFTGATNQSYHIKPNEHKVNIFYNSLNDFEGHLLDRKNNFKADFKYYFENDNGITILGKKTLKWPVTDGYNIDFSSEYYVDYVTKLLDIAEKSDNSTSNIISNMLVSDSIYEFDTYDQKMGKTLNIYGRNFDELKRQSTGIKFAHTVTYDKKNNIPDSLVKNLARTMGWELTTSLFNVDLGGDFLTNDNESYLSPVESEIEFWRRLVLNTPWVWKSKGTRKVIEFLLRFFGTPIGLVNVNEYVYKGDTLVDIEEVREVAELFGVEFDEDTVPVDSDGFPRILNNTSGMYYQKGGNWYRQTSGENSTIDVLSGNNPHVGPYDGGLEYLNQFNTVVPGFEPFVIETPRSETTIHQGYLNYGYGKFDEFFNGNLRAGISTDIDFDVIYSTELDKCTDIDETCDITSRWALETYLDEALLSNEEFFTSIDGSLPTNTELISALENVQNTLAISSSQEGGLFYLIETLEDCDSGSQLSNKNIQFRLKLSFDYDCSNVILCGENIVEGKQGDGLILFQDNPDNTVPSKECCRELGFTSDLVPGGFNCYNSTEGMTANADVYVFMCATSIEVDDALIAKNQIIDWHNRYRNQNDGYIGNLYFIPLTSENWLSYPNKIKSGVVTIHNSSGWNGVAVLPPNLNTNDWVAPTEVLLISLIDKSTPTYHSNSLTLSGQPTTQFINDYKTFAGNIKTHYNFFKGIVYPIIKDTSGNTSAFILHTLAAIEGTILTQDEVDDLESPVTLNSLTTSNVYENYVIPNSSPTAHLRPLKEFNWSSMYNNITPAGGVYASEQFINDLNNLMIVNSDKGVYIVDSSEIEDSETDI